MPIIRDAETEELLREYTRPILKVAGLANQKVEVVIINDRQFNAFVADGKRIFVNLGALTDSKTPNQIIGVLAHETGHIAGGHLARRREQIANMQTMAILAMLAGAGAMVAGARGNSDMGQAAPRHADGAADHDPAHAALLCPQPGRIRRPRRREIPRRHPAIAARHGRDLPALRQRFDVHLEGRRSLSAKPSDAARAHHESRKPRAAEPLLQQEGSARVAAPPRHGAREAVRVSATPTARRCGAIRLPILRCPRAMRARSRPIASATFAARWRRSTPCFRSSPTTLIFTSCADRRCSKREKRARRFRICGRRCSFPKARP